MRKLIKFSLHKRKLNPETVRFSRFSQNIKDRVFRFDFIPFIYLSAISEYWWVGRKPSFSRFYDHLFSSIKSFLSFFEFAIPVFCNVKPFLGRDYFSLFFSNKSCFFNQPFFLKARFCLAYVLNKYSFAIETYAY